MLYNEKERQCVRFLARCLQDGDKLVDKDKLKKALEVDDREYNSLIRQMEVADAIRDATTSSMGIIVVALEISPHVTQLARDLDREERIAQAPPDIVDKLQARARRHPWIARIIVTVLVLAIVVPLVNSIWELIEKIVGAFF
jgi:hypothetical protein